MHPEDAMTMLFRHNHWANLLLIERCAALSDAQLDATIIGTFGTIRDTLQHVVTAERSYLTRISTGQPFRRPKDAPPLTMSEIREWAEASGTALIEWAPKVQPSDTVPIDWDGETRPIPTALLLTQSINHATEHRAQVMAIMTQLGVQPPELAGWSYYEQFIG